VKQKGWKNVHIVEGDACTFQPPEGIATLVTFSYSLSSRLIPLCQCFLSLGQTLAYHLMKAGETTVCQS